MRRPLLPFLLAAALVPPVPAHAVVHAGNVAPYFSKEILDSFPTANASLTDYAGKVLILFLLGNT
jgi:hypothetical protein